MNPRPDPDTLVDNPSSRPTSMSESPTGLQSMSELGARRRTVIALNVATWAALNGAAALVLGSGGWTLIDAVMMLCFAMGTPWTVLGFWNSVIGLWLLQFRRDGLLAVAPYAPSGQRPVPLVVRTAVFMTLRNEDPERAITRLRQVKASVDATGHGAMFDWFLLSDTNRADVAAREEALSAAWAAEQPGARIVYRRRTENTGYKAGNVRDFCERWGADYELMLPLDADSLMTGETIVEHARIMQAHPTLGILQSLVVGMPSKSLFARAFQFGMRQGMRTYIAGHSWWTADCGPFWGHNAFVRVAPFRDYCHLPVISGTGPLAGHVMSHDQVEATLMRKAGYEVRVYPAECGSYEENPPTMLDFSKRDLRWCLGNLQYAKLLDLPGLLPMSRFQLVWAILMFISVPAWALILALLPFKVMESELATFPAGLAIGVYLTYLVMYLMPKLAGLVDILLTKGGVARYGGPVRLAASATGEILISFLLNAVTTFRLTMFIVRLAFGNAKISWSGQDRDAKGISWATAASGLWPVTLFGLWVLVPVALVAPAVALWSLPMTLGYLTAIPFAVWTSDPRLGLWAERIGFAGIPEDFAAPPEIVALRRGA
jgi:membrane glycosyltransferase